MKRRKPRPKHSLQNTRQSRRLLLEPLERRNLLNADFGARIDLAVGSNPAAVAAGDLDNNGTIDLVVANRSDDDLSLLLSNGDGTYATTRVAVGDEPHSLAILDTDGINGLDIVVVNAGSDEVTLLRNLGSGAFAAAAPLGTVSNASKVVTLDADGQSGEDIAVLDDFNGDVSLFLNDGAGNFGTPTIVGFDNRSSTLVTGDFNGDGHHDLAAGRSFGRTVGVRLGNGDGTFASQQRERTDDDPRSLTIADIDNDQDSDLIVGDEFGGITILRNDVSSFAGGATVVGFSALNDIVALDANNDGIQDVATVEEDSGILYVLEGNGDGTFSEPDLASFFDRPTALAAADLDADGDHDLIVLDAGADQLTILPINSPTRITGTVFRDVNGDGVANDNAGGIENATVYLDVDNNGLPDDRNFQTQSLDIFTINPGVTLDPGFFVSDNRLSFITGIEVSLDMDIGDSQELAVKLRSPTGTTVTLVDGFSGGTVTFEDTVFSSSGTTELVGATSPYTGTFAPRQPFTAFFGESARGDWELIVENTATAGVQHRLKQFTVSITGVETTATTDLNGEYALVGATPGTFGVGLIPLPGFSITSPTSGTRSLTVEAGEVVNDQHFGLRSTRGTVNGFKWEDSDGNGQFDQGEQDCLTG